jgi:hypothetical protein
MGCEVPQIIFPIVIPAQAGIHVALILNRNGCPPARA